ncbi:hypothetical protein EV127DRAFT_427077 [Xylaria flabelliformis]|nr:hypothetical protein EV127DRAFT_427077 [Xylaria flabelliformis]
MGGRSLVFFLGDVGLGISLGVGNSDMLCLFVVILAIEKLGGMFSSFRPDKALVLMQVLGVDGMDEGALHCAVGVGRLEKVCEGFSALSFVKLSMF